MTSHYLLLLIAVLVQTCDRPGRYASAFAGRHGPSRIDGLSLVAPPEPFSRDPMPAVKAAGAEWIAVIPYAYTRPGEPVVHHENLHWQWWGESREGALRTMELAKAQGLRIMLKPQVYVPGSWTGAIAYGQEADWAAWEKEYADYLLDMAEIAEICQADLFCIGTEFRLSVRHRPDFWKQLIAAVRKKYGGKVTYAANWDDFEEVPFWQDLDYIGTDAYFPLLDHRTPTTEDLEKAWQQHRTRLKAFAQKTGKPILFTEYGYLSVDSCAWKTWELEERLGRLAINEQAQANALDAIHRVFRGEPYWAGGFLWKWFPNMRGHEGYPEKDYTPQGKLGEEILNKWYSQ